MQNKIKSLKKGINCESRNWMIAGSWKIIWLSR